MNKSSRRSRPPTGRTNLSRTGSSLMLESPSGPASGTASSNPFATSNTSHPPKFVNPIIAARKKKPTPRPASSSGDSVSGQSVSSSFTTMSEFNRRRMAHFVNAPEPEGYSSGLKTRSALIAKRKHDRAHFFDRYDLDGDGVVDPFEVRLGALIDLDGDGEISQDEKDYLRDLIDQGVLKHISFLTDKTGGEAKKAMTWKGTKEYRRVEREKAMERMARETRIAATKNMAKEVDLATSNSALLSGLAKRLSPSRSLEKILRPLVHRGHTPMQRVMSGRKTPSLEYKDEPRFKSRSELMAHRKAKNSVHRSFDLDGDGVVDPLEHFIASMLDINQDGELSDDEKKQAHELIQMLKSRYVTGLDRAGPHGGVRIFQRPDGTVMEGVIERKVPDSMNDVLGGKGVVPSSNPSSARGLSSARSQSASVGSQCRTPNIWSPGRGSSVLSRAGSSASVRSLADDFRARRSTGDVPMPTPIKDPTSGAEMLRVDSGRPRTGMSNLVGM